MAIYGSGGGRFSQWMSNGLVSTIAWVFVLIVYCAFRAFGIEDPILGQVFLLLTGLWVGNLTIAQGKKSAKVEQDLKELKEVVRAEQLDGDKE